MKINLFQFIVIGAFVLCAIGGIIAFAMFNAGGKPAVSLSVWGEVPREHFDAMILAQPDLKERYVFSYTYVPREDFGGEFTDALAEGSGPDLILISSDELIEQSGRILPISYESYPASDYADTFLPQTTHIYQGQNGWRGLPALVDPLVLYSNQQLLAQGGYVDAPRTWEELPSFVESITTFGDRGEILRSAIPLGTFSNVASAKAILSSLFFQAGTSITVRDFQGDLESALLQEDSKGINGAQYALNFFTQFSDPSKSFYTWNPSLSDADAMFLSGTLALYPAFASEYSSLQAKNPNLSIALSAFPQARISDNKSVYGRLYGWSITRAAESKYADAIGALAELTSPRSVDALAQSMRVAPAVKSSYATEATPADPALDFPGRSVVRSSAIIARAWEDPDPAATYDVLADMVEGVVSGRLRLTDAISQGDRDLNYALR